MMEIVLLGPYRPKLPDGSYNFGPDAAEAFQELEALFTCGERVVQCRNTDCISTAILTDYNRGHLFYACSNYHAWAVRRSSGLVELPSLPPLRRSR